MDLEQIIQRLEWLDGERRKDKALITDLQNRLAGYEGRNNVLEGRIKNLEKSLSDLKSVTARISQFDQALEKYRADVQALFAEAKKQQSKQHLYLETIWQEPVQRLQDQLAEISARLTVLPEIQASLQALDEVDQSLRRAISKAEQKSNDWNERLEDLRRALSTLDENRRQDLKRIADVQGEITAIRRRIEEVREKSALWQDTSKLLDARINQLMGAEEERRREQMAFIENLSRQQVERDRAWKEIKSRFEAISQQASTLDLQLAKIQETHRQAERALESFDEINERLKRRIGEITEMQRLAEDRLRQEWVSFKADDQKRWGAHVLTTEAQYKEVQSQLQKLVEKLTALDDEIQTQRAILEQEHSTTEAQLQALMNWVHQWLETFSSSGGLTR